MKSKKAARIDGITTETCQRRVRDVWYILLLAGKRARLLWSNVRLCEGFWHYFSSMWTSCVYMIASKVFDRLVKKMKGMRWLSIRSFVTGEWCDGYPSFIYYNYYFLLCLSGCPQLASLLLDSFIGIILLLHNQALNN